MVNHIESIPEARLLLMSLRSVGYTEETAIADILDNSISADATEIKITFSWDNERIVITDNGIGIRDTNKPAGIILSDPEGNEYYFPAAVEKDGNGVPTVIYETSR